MKKYNNYKKYYESQKEQEKARTLAYYKEHREEILAKKREKRKNMPKVKKPTLTERLAVVEKALELACERVKYFEEMQDKEMGFSEFFGYDSNYDLQAIIEQYKEYAKEMLKDE